MHRIRTFLLDLDGTFYLGDKIFPWSLDFVNTVRSQNKNFIFVTNNSSRHGRYYVEKSGEWALTSQTTRFSHRVKPQFTIC